MILDSPPDSRRGALNLSNIYVVISTKLIQPPSHEVSVVKTQDSRYAS